MEEVYVFFVFLYCMYLSRIRFLAETDRLVMTLFVVVTTNSVFSRAILPVMVLASTSKTGMVILRGLFHESFVSVTHRLVCYQETLLLSILTIILLYDPSLTCKFTPTPQAHTRWFKWACSHDWLKILFFGKKTEISIACFSLANFINTKITSVCTLTS